MSYKQRPKKKAPSTATIATPRAPSWLDAFRIKFANAFAPLNKYQQAIYYTGNLKKTSKTAKWFQKNARTIAVVEKIVVLVFAVFALFKNPYLLLLLPTMGALIYYRNRVKWLWWKLKVFVLQRKFYENRRNLYKSGSLYHHLSCKWPKRYKRAIIWGESPGVQEIKFRKLQKDKNLTTKEYISL